MMKFSSRFFLSLLVLALCFSACKKDDEPEPKPQSYLEYSGKVYELKTADYSYLTNNKKKLFLSFFSLFKEEMPGSDPLIEQRGSRIGSWIELSIISTTDREIEPGNYPLINGRSENSSISAINFFIEMDTESRTGILISPVSGEVTISNTEEGKLVVFDFMASNGEKVTGRFQGNIQNQLDFLE